MLLIATAPALLLGLIRVSFLVAALWDVHPFWRFHPLNLAEAAALRDRGEVARLLAEGQDPNATYHVRRGMLPNNTAQATPMAAARAARRDDILQILVDSGAKPDTPEQEPTHAR